jgi:hypothetical protein
MVAVFCGVGKGYYVKIVTLSEIDAVFENSYCIQITETGFVE